MLTAKIMIRIAIRMMAGPSLKLPSSSVTPEALAREGRNRRGYYERDT